MKKITLTTILLLASLNAFGQGGIINGGAQPAVVGTMSVVSGYNKGTTVTQWNLQCAGATNMLTQDCSSTTPTNVIGVAENIVGSYVSVITNGQTLVNLTGTTPIAGHTVCPDPVNAGQVVDSGGTGMCSGSITIGTIIAIDITNISGLGSKLWDGVTFTPTGSAGGCVHAAPCTPLIDMTMMGGAGGSTGGFAAGGDLTGSGTSQNVVKLDFSNTHIPLGAAPTANQVLALDSTAANVIGNSSPLFLQFATSVANANAVANGTVAWGLYIPYPVTFGNIVLKVTTADGSAGSATCGTIAGGASAGSRQCYDFGVFDSSGNLVADTGPVQLSSTGVFRVATVQGSKTIPAGKYYWAITGTAATGAINVGATAVFNFAGGTGGTNESKTTSGGQLVSFTPVADSWASGQTPVIGLN